MRKVQSAAWKDVLATRIGSGGPSAGEGPSGATSTTACGASDDMEIFTSVIVAGLAVLSGSFETRQQEPWPVGVSEICGVCPMCICIIIIAQWPPQWAAGASLGLQFATAASGDPKSTRLNIIATSLKRQFTSFKAILFRLVIRACDIRHIQW